MTDLKNEAPGDDAASRGGKRKCNDADLNATLKADQHGGDGDHRDHIAGPDWASPEAHDLLSFARHLCDFARAVCGARIIPGPELLDPEIDALAVDAFRRLAEYLDELTAQYERALA